MSPTKLGSRRISRSQGFQLGMRFFVVAAALQLSSCASYVSYLSPPDPAKFESPVDFAIAYTGGKEHSSTGVRVGGGQQCGMHSSAGRNGFNAGAADICRRKGGAWNAPVCASGESVLFVAVAKDSLRRICNQGLDDFVGIAYEPPPSMSQQRFTNLMEVDGYKAPVRVQAEARAREQVAEEESKRRALEMAEQRERQQRAQSQARERLLARGAEFRKSIKIGSVTNCGPVIEIRQNLAKIYFPVHGYGNEHWLGIDALFPAGVSCQFVNGRYVAPT